MHIKWAGCPFCGKTMEVSVEPGGPVGFKLGEPKLLTCPRCGKQFTDGSREWDRMGFFGKVREVLLAAVAGLIMVPVLGFLAGFAVGGWLGLGGVWFPGLCALLASAVYFYGFRLMITESKARTSTTSHGDSSSAQPNAATPEAPPNVSALLAPLGTTQALYEGLRRQAADLCRSVQRLHSPDTGSDVASGRLLAACILFSWAALFRKQLLTTPSWPATHEFKVVYGQVKLLVQFVLASRTVPYRRLDRMNVQELFRIMNSSELAQESDSAGALLSQMEEAFLYYVDNVGKTPSADQHVFDVFFVQASTPGTCRADVRVALADLFR